MPKKSLPSKKFILAVMEPDWIKPFASIGRLIPVIKKSDHPLFTIGRRFDYAFLQVALNEGYTVLLEQL